MPKEKIYKDPIKKKKKNKSPVFLASQARMI